jgi:hypothetical protein
VFTVVMVSEGTSEMSVKSYQTTERNNPEDSHLHTRARKNLKSHSVYLFSGKSSWATTDVIADQVIAPIMESASP